MKLLRWDFEALPGRQDARASGLFASRSIAGLQAEDLGQELEREAARALDLQKGFLSGRSQSRETISNDNALHGNPANFKDIEDAFNVLRYPQNPMAADNPSHMTRYAPQKPSDPYARRIEFRERPDIHLCEAANPDNENIEFLCIFRGMKGGCRQFAPLPRGMKRSV